MSIIKRVLSYIVISCLLLSFSGCGKQQADKPIVVLGPMECEYAYLADRLENRTQSTAGNFTIYEGTIENYPVVVINCLVGMVNAASAATYAIDNYNPEFVIMQGTSGSHNADLYQHDIVLGADCVNMIRYNSPHRDAGEGSKITDWDYKGTEMLVDGEVQELSVLHSDDALLSLAADIPYEYGKVVRGTIGTSDAWNKEIDLINYFHETLGTDCEEMENFSVAQVCKQFGVPFLGVRVISNGELHPQETFTAESGEHCQEYVLNIMKEWISKTRSAGSIFRK
ncbi:MAG: 5'-methylthioadenosine/S-adenosylhomocysteine nucleosidase [Eubacteriales bacterium]|nr:5'-methylthioadenosine/S-adenosylhomocysteine nucleosidase [Eubacteriales bacterium]